jgi:hypothetical protein
MKEGRKKEDEMKERKKEKKKKTRRTSLTHRFILHVQKNVLHSNENGSTLANMYEKTNIKLAIAK